MSMSTETPEPEVPDKEFLAPDVAAEDDTVDDAEDDTEDGGEKE